MAIADRIVDLVEGNPGALTVLKLALSFCAAAGYERLLHTLERRDCRGPKIWIAYKDRCGQDIGVFVAHVYLDADEFFNDL